MSEERFIEYLPLAKLKGAKRNPKSHDIPEIQLSIEENGYVEPIVLDERTGRLVAGHGRLQTLLSMSKQGTPPPEGVKESDEGWTVPVVRGWSSRNDTEAERYLLASNQLTMRGGWKKDELKTMLDHLSEQQSLAGSGFTQGDPDSLFASAEAPDVSALLEESKQPSSDVPCSKCPFTQRG